MEIKVDSKKLETIIEEVLPKLIAEKLSSSYGNPISAVIDDEIKGITGELRIFVKAILASVLTNPEFKVKIADIVLAKIVQQGLKQ